MNYRFPSPLLVVVAALSAGCGTTYVTPAAGVSFEQIADLQAVTDRDLRSYYARDPVSPFPAHVAMIRVQDSGYYSRTNRGYGHGRYSIITTRDIESDESFATMQNLPMVAGVAPIGRLLLPANANTIRDLRKPAAELRADMLLVYSVDSSFAVEGKQVGPLAVVSLGFLKNRQARVTSTVAGILVDVRTGFVYGSSEATATEEQKANLWSTEIAIDASRLHTEQKAFDEFIGEFAELWSGVVNMHARSNNETRRHEHVVCDANCSELVDSRFDKNSYFRVRFATP